MSCLHFGFNKGGARINFSMSYIIYLECIDFSSDDCLTIESSVLHLSAREGSLSLKKSESSNYWESLLGLRMQKISVG